MPFAKTKFSWPVLHAGVFATALIASSPVFAESTPTLMALSEIKREEMPVPAPAGEDETSPVDNVPLPDPIRRLPLPDTPATRPELDDGIEEDQSVEPVPSPEEPVAEILYDVSLLPEEVRRMRELILAACRKGDLEALRPLLGMGDDATQLSLGEGGEDPIEFLRGISGDESGQEILAILLEILDAGYVHLEAGTPNELYVWPYFFAAPLEKLSAEQRVELFKIVTAGDYEEMKLYGAYNFYRTGIAPDGRWVFFVAGD